MVVAVSNQKGGVGKTTTAVTIAHLLHDEGLNVGLLDLDAPGSGKEAGAAAGYRRAREVGIPAYTSENLPARLPHHLLIDCPPDMSDRQARYAIDNSDLLIVPTGLSLDDLEVTQAYAERMVRSVKTTLLFTRVNPVSERSLREAQAHMREQGFNVISAFVKAYSIYLDASAFGSVAGINTREGRRATRDYEKVVKEIYG